MYMKIMYYLHPNVIEILKPSFKSIIAVYIYLVVYIYSPSIYQLTRKLNAVTYFSLGNVYGVM